MPETPTQYRQRLNSYIEGRDPLAIQADTPRRLAQLIANRSAEQLTTPPAPGKWSVAEIFAHHMRIREQAQEAQF